MAEKRLYQVWVTLQGQGSKFTAEDIERMVFMDPRVDDAKAVRIQEAKL